MGNEDAAPLENDDRLMTAREACVALRISRPTLSRLTKSNNGAPPRLAHYRIGSRILFSQRRHVEPFLLKCEISQQENGRAKAA